MRLIRASRRGVVAGAILGAVLCPARGADEPLPLPAVVSPQHSTLGTPLPPAQPEPGDRPLPINLPTALKLAGARPLVIGAAQASLEVAVAELGRAKVLWLPNLTVGVGYYRHDGANQGASGSFSNTTQDRFLAGGGALLDVSTADAIYAPLAGRQVLRARQIDVQTAQNEALLSTAQAYFRVQVARGRLAGAQDIVTKGNELADKVRHLRLGLAAPTDADRALALEADFEQAVDLAREAWRIASADLTQVLRLDPAAVVVPVEPPHLQVTLIPPETSVDGLIPVALTSRPELASQQALVRAALVRIRQERMRPLIPSLILKGGAGSVDPSGTLMGGIFASDVNGSHNPTQPRDDVSLGLVWGLDNLGFGNRARVRERRGEQQRELIELFRAQDAVAGDVVRAHAQLESAARRVGKAERELREAQIAYAGSMKDLGEVVSIGDTKLQVQRFSDVVSSIQSLARAYDNYFGTVGDYNTAQFRLYRALGFPAGALSCDPNLGAALLGERSTANKQEPVGVTGGSGCRDVPPR